MVPIEEGERCHVCGTPATRFGLHVAWCDTCSGAMLLRSGLKCLGTTPKAAVPQHAMQHASRWHTTVSRLLLHHSGGHRLTASSLQQLQEDTVSISFSADLQRRWQVQGEKPASRAEGAE